MGDPTACACHLRRHRARRPGRQRPRVACRRPAVAPRSFLVDGRERRRSCRGIATRHRHRARRFAGHLGRRSGRLRRRCRGAVQGVVCSRRRHCDRVRRGRSRRPPFLGVGCPFPGCRRRREHGSGGNRGRGAARRRRKSPPLGPSVVRRALAFLTPLGGAAVPDRRTMSWFPVVGALIGLAVGGAWWAADRIWPPMLAAAIAVAVDLALTGLLHVDGLADSADGLLPHMPRRRRLEVMAEPTVGAYGIAVTASVLLLRFGAFASMRPSVLLVAGAWCGSRTVMAVTARAVPDPRTAGGL